MYMNFLFNKILIIKVNDNLLTPTILIGSLTFNIRTKCKIKIFERPNLHIWSREQKKSEF